MDAELQPDEQLPGKQKARAGARAFVLRGGS
jgi:hypothetical protein